jgi:hypothetical protein
MIRWKPGEPSGLYKTILNSRGWGFQELLLSRRRVYFTKGQLYWHCQWLTVSEDDHDGIYGTTFLTGGGAAAYGLRLWHELIADFSSKYFSFSTDRLAAIVGIVDWYQAKTGQVPIIGL